MKRKVKKASKARATKQFRFAARIFGRLPNAGESARRYQLQVFARNGEEVVWSETYVAPGSARRVALALFNPATVDLAGLSKVVFEERPEVEPPTTAAATASNNGSAPLPQPPASGTASPRIFGAPDGTPFGAASE